MPYTYKVYSTYDEIQQAARKAVQNRVCMPAGELRDHYRDILSHRNIENYLCVIIVSHNGTPISSCLAWRNYQSLIEFQVFVRREHRRKHIGSNLYTICTKRMKAKKILKRNESLYVIRWNKTSKNFFDDVER